MKLNLSFLLLALGTLACNTKSETQNHPVKSNLEILVGTYTGEGSDGIYSVQFDPTTGVLSDKKLLVETANPSFIARSKNHEIVFSVNETQEGGVSSFAWDETKELLKLVSRRDSQGDYPCYLSLNPEESFVSIANYGTGNVITYPIDQAGVISTKGMIKQHEDTGPNPERQEGPHAHFSMFSNDGKNIYTVDLGIDQVIKYPVHGSEIGAGVIALSLESGDGPRHLAFHPTLPIVYVITELTNMIVTASIDSAGIFQANHRISTLPKDFEGESYCADIHVSEDGRYLYASNRGHNSIAIFSIAEDGSLDMIATEPAYGDWPRNFALTPDNNYLLVANQRSNNITVFQRDSATGMLYYTSQQIEISQPVCLIF
ncbi:lactonase family protein [Reichenbachiella agarivorans]|uniref:Lactonase family protein n=1 Tax=Reichenbachiella agarivorans TaxID=2979464 RepID=A0ABY6CWB8_9BACT|nr:lactonase family protein [Reichenbachiella agarivorans]UXP33688.1 lactonase family protein [Reichenbachiella agarivorans]